MRPGILALLALAAATTAAASPATARLVILSTTDLHGYLYPTTYFKPGLDEPVGLARVATLIKAERAREPNVLLVDSGDLLQGSPLADWFQRKGRGVHPMVAAFNALGYDAFAVGNHDFDYGLDLLDKARHDARFPFLAANIFRDGKPEFEPSVVREIGGIDVGLVGAAPPGIALWSKRHVEGKLEFREVVDAVENEALVLRARGMDIVVAVPHCGWGGDGAFGPSYSGYTAESGLPPEQVGSRLAREVPELDVVLLGHSHQTVTSREEGGKTLLEGASFGKPASDRVERPIAAVQAGYWGSHLGKVTLELARQAHHWEITARRAELLPTKGVPPDPALLALGREAHEATLRYLGEAVASTAETWDARLARIQDTPLVDLVNFIQARRSGAQLSAAACFSTDAGLASGSVSLAGVAALYPYDNALLALRVTGKQLRAYLERSARYYAPYRPGAEAIAGDQPGFNYDMVSGADYAIDLTRPAGSRIVRLEVQGRPVTDDLTFTLALNSYRAQGGGGYDMLRDAPVVYNRDENIRDLLVEYLREKGAIGPREVFKPNWRLLPEGAIDPATLRYREP